MEDDTRIIEIQGKHGLIKLVVPNKKPTESEVNELHRVIAETIVRSNKAQGKEKAATNQ